MFIQAILSVLSFRTDYVGGQLVTLVNGAMPERERKKCGPYWLNIVLLRHVVVVVPGGHVG